MTSPDISIPPVLSVWCDLANYPPSSAKEVAWCPGVGRWGRHLSAVKEYDRQNKSHQSTLTTSQCYITRSGPAPAPVWPEERSVHHTPPPPLSSLSTPEPESQQRCQVTWSSQLMQLLKITVSWECEWHSRITKIMTNPAEQCLTALLCL